MSNIRPDAFEALVGEWISEVGHLHKQIKDLPGAVDSALFKTRTILVDAQSNLAETLKKMPGAADNELKRASDAAITKMSAEVAQIAQKIAGNAAEAAAAEAKTEAAKWLSGALIVGMIVGAISCTILMIGLTKIEVTNAHNAEKAALERAAAAESGAAAAVTAAVSDATKKFNSEFAMLKSGNSWSASAEGVKVINCKMPTWRIAEYTDGTRQCITNPAVKNIIGDDTKAVGFWMQKAK